MSIEELQKEFLNWRKSKKSHRDPIPAELWEAAVELAKSSGHSLVADKLAISTTDLKRRMGIDSQSRKKFVFQELATPMLEKKMIFELTFPGGVSLKVYQ